MKFAILLSVSVILLVLTSIWKTSSNYQQGQRYGTIRQQAREDPTSLRARLKKAKPNASNEVIFGAPEPILADVSSLDEALANYSVIVAIPIDAMSIQTDPRNIVTYYKFRVLEKLSQKHLPLTGVPENLPSELPSLKDNEIYVLEGGGSVVIDGIKVTQKSLYGYSLSEKYLLFTSKNSSETVAMVSLGKYGVFRISANDDDTLQPIATEVTPVARDMKERHANKISRLKIALK